MANRRSKRSQKEMKLEYKRYPWVLWICGFVVMWFALYLTYHLIAGTSGGVIIIKSFTKR